MEVAVAEEARLEARQAQQVARQEAAAAHAYWDRVERAAIAIYAGWLASNATFRDESREDRAINDARALIAELDRRQAEGGKP